jgi:hypothetical protein
MEIIFGPSVAVGGVVWGGGDVGDVGDVGGVEDVGDVGDVGRGTCGIGGMSEWIRTIRVSMRRRVKKTERDIWNKNEYLE